MLEPNPFPEGDQKPLPLFRAEAMAAQQQKFYGEILLIRPFSLTVFFWLGMGISALVLGFLLLGNATTRIRVSGVLHTQGGTAPHAEINVPPTSMRFVRVGDTVPIHSISQTSIGSVRDIAKSATEPTCKVTVMLPGLDVGRFPDGTKIEADLPGENKPLLKWLFERTQ